MPWFPTCPPSACTCNPDCCRLEVRPSLEKELSAGAAQRGAWGSGGCCQGAVPGRLRPGELGRSSCAAGARETGAGAGYLLTVPPGVKVNLKPSPSRLSKQKQRPTWADEYSLPQKSNPSAPAPTQKPGSSRDRLARRRKSRGKSRTGGRGTPHSSVSALSGAWLLTNCSQGHRHPFQAPVRLRPLSGDKAWTLPQAQRGKG